MRRVWIVVATVCVASSAWAQQDAKAEEKAAEERAKARLVEFRKSLRKCQETDHFVDALAGLANEPHALILAELKLWLAKPQYEIRLKAAEEISKFTGDGKASATLIAAAVTEKETGVATAYLDRLLEIRHRASVRNLAPLFNHREKIVAQKATEIAGAFRTKDAVELLIGQLFKLEGDRKKHTTQDSSGINNGPDFGTSAYGQQAGAMESAAKRIEDMITCTRQALLTLTKQPYMSSMQYKEWWAKAKTTWKEPDPEDED